MASLLLPRVRSLVGLGLDLVRPAQRTGPDFGRATWLMGVTPGSLLEAVQIRPVGASGLLNPSDSWRIEYATSDTQGRILSATGAVFRSRTPWMGKGERPTIAFAPSTQGVARRCDPSYSCTVGIEPRIKPIDLIAAYEQPVINLFLAAGADVVITDYPRDPGDDVELYCDHVAAARSLADAVRASTNLGVGTAKLGLWGFSQGGGAAAAWLEEPEYAPDLQLLAAVVAAPPVDMVSMLHHVDGALASVVILYAVAGLMASDDAIAAEIAPHLSPRGVAAIANGARTCALGAVLHRPWSHTRSWTRTGVSMASLLDDLPLTSSHLDATRLGTKRPLGIPIRLWSSPYDDLVPHSDVSALAESWGVEFLSRTAKRIRGRTGTNHFGPYFLYAATDVGWLLDRLNG